MSNSNILAGQKRKAQLTSSTATATSKKRQKFHDMRAIPTQTADAALSKSGELNIASFIKAREFEINALDKSMKRARQGLMSRAFQQVPRHLRRRTASHNAKKVPKRLRERAEREMREDNTPKVTSKTRTPTARLRLRIQTAKSLKQLTQKRKTVRQKKREARANASETDPAKHIEISRAPAVKKNKLANPPLATSKFKRRQVSKTWLPTHLWHTKRARMTLPNEPLWRMAIPLTPTEKTYRATHRAAGCRGCIAWDKSYMSTVGCLGTGKALESLLKKFHFHGENWSGQKYERWKRGSRFARGWILEQGTDAAMAEVDVVWCGSDDNVSIGKTQAYKADQDIEMPDVSVTPKRQKIKLDRRILIRVHPSAFHLFWTQLLKIAKMQKPQVLVEDLRFEIGSLEITGPGSTEALVGVLKPYKSDDAITKLWMSLSSVSDPAMLPLNVLLPLSISDPRLHRPSKKLEVPCDETSMAALHSIMVEWPVDKDIRPSTIFSHRARHLAAKMPTQKAIDRRRKDLLPGQPIQVTTKDPKIPVMLLAHRNASPGSTHSGVWTLLAPWNCIDAVWRELMTYPLSSGNQPRFGGLRESQQVAFERRVPWFPCDYPGTEAGKAWERSEAEQRFDEWIRRPPSRRLAWQSLDLGLNRKGELGRGWVCDWEYLFTDTAKFVVPLPVKVDEESHIAQPNTTLDQLPLTQRQRKAARARAEEEQEHKKRRRNTSSPESDCESTSELKAGLLFTQAIPIAAKSFLQGYRVPETSSKPIIVSVRVTLLTKGTPKAAARLYRLPAQTTTKVLHSTAPDRGQSGLSQVATPATKSLFTSSSKSRHNTLHTDKALDLRTRWLSLDPEQPAGDLPRRVKKDKWNHRGLTRKHQHHGEESLRHINVLPKNAPAEIREQYGRKPLTESERVEMMKAQLAVKLEEEKVWDVHVPCPDAEDLIGFVTSAGYNLAEGKGTAIGGLWLQRVLDGWTREDDIQDSNMAGSKARPESHPALHKGKPSQKDRERHLCIVRNAGESIGRLGIWELCD